MGAKQRDGEKKKSKDSMALLLLAVHSLNCSGTQFSLSSQIWRRTYGTC